MTNRDSAYGFKCVEGTQMGTRRIGVDASNASPLGVGDPIIFEADGKVARAAAGSGVAIAGVVVGAMNSSKKPLLYLPASTAGYVIYIPAQNGIFSIQADTGTAVAETAIGATADLTVGDCSTVTGRSIYELDSSDIGTGTTVRILGKVDRPDNTWAAHVDLIVKFVESAFDDATTI